MEQIPKIERNILKFWQKNNIFAKLIKSKKKKPFFSFYDGPPFASGLPHYGHILASTIKDTVLRYWSMVGYQIPWRVGWDCHGLPVENMVEKKLGLKSKKDIEKFGIKKFNQICQSSVFLCLAEWEKTLRRVGRWSDYANAYATMDNDYIESVWWVFKQLWNQGLIYQAYRVTPYCPRCGTPLSNFELNQPGAYQDVEDESVYLKFKLKNPHVIASEAKQSRGKNGIAASPAAPRNDEVPTFLLVWTTTPWCLPANTAIAISPDAVYVKAKFNNEYYILAKNRLSVLAPADQYQIVQEFLGKEIINKEYQPLYPMELDKPAYRVVPADFVSVEDGTGLVTISPTFGEEDMELGRELDLSDIVTVDEEGKIIKGLNIPGEGKFVKQADQDIKADLRKRGLLFREEKIVHAYPFCWRCDSPLLYYPINSWYVAVTKFKKELVENNKKIRWVPEHLKQGRFGKWLEGARDWSISRNRYWGAPIPVWQCQQCGKTEAIGGLDELAKKNKSNNYFILRHGQTENNLVQRIYTENENFHQALTKKGVQQIKRSVAQLKKAKIDLIFASDYLRTRQTAEIIGQAIRIKVIYDKRLREIEVGPFEGKSQKDYDAYFNNDELKRFVQAPPQGENLNQVKKRIIDFLLAVNEKYSNKNIILVGHGDPLWILAGAAQGLKNEEIVAKKAALYLKPGQMAVLKFKEVPFDEHGNLNLHRPFADEIVFPCACGNQMKRIPEVFDCWFESGSMPYGQWHYPFANKKLVEKTFPADFIAEGLDQTRGWFYTLHVLATALTLKNIGLGKNTSSFKNVIVNGLILGEDGKKLSKRLKNYTAPEIIFDKYGADALRYYLLTSAPMGEDYILSEKRVAETFRRTILTFWNCFTFLRIYQDQLSPAPKTVQTKNTLDKWIISRLNTLNQEIIDWMNKYELTKAARLIDPFLDDFSNWYIRRSRRRLQKPVNSQEKQEAEKILSFVLLNFAKLTAPFLPFITEEIYQKLKTAKGKQSVHLADYPKLNKKLIDKQLEEKMEQIRELATLALAQRAKAGIKVRQPLLELRIKNKELSRNKELLDLLKDEINVKEIVFDGKIKEKIELNTELNEELKFEGIIRDLIRFIQGMRKDAGLKPKQLIYLRCSADSGLQKLIQKYEKEIILETSSKKIEFTPKKNEIFLVEKEFTLDERKVWLGIKK